MDHSQLSLPRAGHSMCTTMDNAMDHSPCRYEEELVGEEGKGCVTRTLIMFGGGDNEGNFYSDLTTLNISLVGGDLVSFKPSELYCHVIK